MSNICKDCGKEVLLKRKVDPKNIVRGFKKVKEDFIIGMMLLEQLGEDFNISQKIGKAERAANMAVRQMDIAIKEIEQIRV